MSKTYRVYQVDSFTQRRFTGNPAGVVTNADGLGDDDMRNIARELNNSETAFVFNGKRDDSTECDVHVRFFTPSVEVPICGHATIAAHYVYALENHFSGHVRVTQKTGAGILPVDVYEESGDYRVVMTQGQISIDDPLAEGIQSKIMKALGLPMEQRIPELPIVIASTGHSKVLIGIQSIEKLHTLHPDLSALTALSAEIGCNGYYVFTLHSGEDPLIHGRMFAPAIGIAEDPVTGNANGPLGAYLVHAGFAGSDEGDFSFNAAQGEAIGRSGIIQVDVTGKDGKPAHVCVSGNAVVVFRTEITI